MLRRMFECCGQDLTSPLPSPQALKKRPQDAFLLDFCIGLIGLDDLIKMKEVAGRKQDVSDIEAIQKLKTFTGA